MDPWVVRNVLGPNITTCGFNRQAVVHTSKAEAFLQKWVADGRRTALCGTGSIFLEGLRHAQRMSMKNNNVALQPKP